MGLPFWRTVRPRQAQEFNQLHMELTSDDLNDGGDDCRHTYSRVDHGSMSSSPCAYERNADRSHARRECSSS
ncbi:hypothetical protein EI94DRAFT_1724691 [Lactarius quietus]|nr:hypothetical protein EI94DRAFT_1724691 [Lactarius quietus]